MEYDLNGNSIGCQRIRCRWSTGLTCLLSTSLAIPWAARTAFTGFSNGYMTTRYDLSSLHGNTVRIRFRLGVDDL